MKRSVSVCALFLAVGIFSIGNQATASNLQRAPRLVGFVEEAVDLEGTLEVLVEDHAEGSQMLYFLDADGERYELSFASQPPQMMSGQKLRVKGTRLDHAITVDSSSPNLIGDVSTSGIDAVSALPNTLGEQRTVVILVNFSNNPSQPYTVATARNVIFTTTSNFDLENSYGQTWLTGDVVGWFTIPVSSTVCDYPAIETDAQAAATAAGVNLNNYTHQVYAFPQNACSWWGLGSLGGSPTRAWINGSLQSQVVAHEMGHNYGLYHSHSLDCHPQTVGGTCTTSEYGDILDTMGTASYHFNSFQKDRLGWLNYAASPPLTTVTTSGTYNIDALETLGTASKGLKIARGTTGSYFYLELRKSIGFDAGMSSYITNGVVVHLASPSDGNTSDLLDMTPASLSFMDAALPSGQTFTDAVSGVSFAVNSVGASSASVSVGLGAPPPPNICTHVPPLVSLVPSQTQGVPAGTPVPFTLTVTNRDLSPCTSSTFNLSSTVPASWTGVFSTPSLTLALGASGTATLTVTSARTAANGSYTITATAKNAAATTVLGTASAVYVVNTGTPGGDGGDFSDNFNRADSNNLGTGWSVVKGGFAIVSNELRNVANAGDSLALAGGLTGTTETVAADFASTDNGKSPQLGLVLRYQNPTNYYALYRNISGGGGKKVRISKIVNGKETILANVTDSNPAEDAFFHLVARVTGTTLTLEMDGAQVATATDATFATGQVGILMASSAASNRADNFTATVQ